MPYFMVREFIHDFAHDQGVLLAFSFKSQWKTLILLVMSGKKYISQCCEPCIGSIRNFTLGQHTSRNMNKKIRTNLTNVSRVNCFYFTLWIKNWPRSLKFPLLKQKSTFSYTNRLQNNKLKNEAIWLELVLTFVFNDSPSHVTNKVGFHMQIFSQEP